MIPSRVASLPENLLGLSWHDSNWIPLLNPSNVLEYFMERSNPFYDRTCNNEIIKMQRVGPEQLLNLTGLEYILLHVQDPILYVIRKIHRHSATQVTPLADYYIIAGTVYQAPDLGSVVGSRLLTAVTNLQSVFDSFFNMSRYHPTKGYSWDTKNQISSQQSTVATTKKDPREEISTNFHRQRVDLLLNELTRRFPIPIIKTEPQTEFKTETNVEQNAAAKIEPKIEIKQEIKEEKMDLTDTPSPSMKAPPEKKAKMS